MHVGTASDIGGLGRNALTLTSPALLMWSIVLEPASTRFEVATLRELAELGPIREVTRDGRSKEAGQGQGQ